MISGLIACAAGGGDSDDDENLSEREDAFTLNATTNQRGIATVSFAVPEGTTKIGVTARVPDDEVFVRFTEFVSGDGTDYLNGGRGISLSLSDAFERYLNAVNAPSRAADPAINSSERFTIEAEAATSRSGGSISGETITFSITTKADPGLTGGRLRVNLFYVGSVGQEQGTRDVVRAALNEFRAIYGGEAGIDLDLQEADVDGPVVLPNPSEGSPFYLAASGSLANPAVNVFIGGDIGGVGGSVLGISSSIPGPFNPSERSAVAVSIFTGAGPDGRYSAEDVRILGETMAHESGHYMGLFHPVDFSGSTVAAEDPLGDTDSCSFVTECLSNGDLISNLMFSSPVQDGNGGFVPQNQLTEEQRGVLNRYIVVD